jgi:hypothetical protein
VSKANVVDPRRAKNNRVQALPQYLSYNESLEFNEGITGINDSHAPQSGEEAVDVRERGKTPDPQ